MSINKKNSLLFTPSKVIKEAERIQFEIEEQKISSIFSVGESFDRLCLEWERLTQRQEEKMDSKEKVQVELLKSKIMLKLLETMLEEFDMNLKGKYGDRFNSIKALQYSLSRHNLIKYIPDVFLFALYGGTTGATAGSLLFSCGAPFVAVIPITLICGFLFVFPTIGFYLRTILQKSGLRLREAPPFFKTINSQYLMLRLMAHVMVMQAEDLANDEAFSRWEAYRKHIEKLFYADLYRTQSTYSKYNLLVEAKAKADNLNSHPLYKIYHYATVMLNAIFVAFVFSNAALLFFKQYATIAALCIIAVTNPSVATIGAAVFIIALAALGFYVGIKMMQLKNSSSQVFISELLGIADGQSRSQLDEWGIRVREKLRYAGKRYQMTYSASPNRSLMSFSTEAAASSSSSP